MLSNKWTFSLTCFVLMLALAFVIPTAMADEFDVTLDMTDDINTADGLQVAHPGTSLEVMVEFGQAVVLKAASVFVTTYDKDGNVTGFPAATVAQATASKEITLTIPVTADDTKVNIRIAKGIASADPINADTSKEFNVDIQLLGADATDGPTVYSIQRNDRSSIPVKDATVDVIITLSEMPKELKKGNIDVSNATHGDPIALTPIAQETVAGISRNVLATTPALTPARKYYDMERAGVESESGLHADISEAVAATDKNPQPDGTDDAGVTAKKEAHIAKLIETHVAVGTADTAAGDEVEDIAIIDPADFPTDELEADADELEQVPLADPMKMRELTFGENASEVVIEVDASQAPTLGQHLAFYIAHKKAYDLYTAELAYRNAYKAALEAEMDKDEAVQTKELNEHLAEHGQTLQVATGRTNMLYPYALTITPKYENKDDIVVKVKTFENTKSPTPDKYDPANMKGKTGYDKDGYKEGVNKLTIKVGREDLKAKALGVKFALPKDKVIPKGGYLVVAEDKAGSSVHVPPGAIDASPKAHERSIKERLYNVIDDGDLPNLETHLLNGGIIDVMGPHALVITEVMWGSDRSLDDPGKSQWIELYNAGAEYKTADGDNTTYLIFYDGTDTLPAASTVKDRVGTTDALGLTWNLAGKGRSGRTAEKVAGTAQVVPTEPLISMYRVMTAGTVANGRMSTSWMQSTPPSTNFESNRLGVHIGTPGAATVKSAAELLAEANAAKAAAAAAAAADAAAAAKTAGTGTVPTSGKIYISEVMFAGEGRLPQWIEISNGSRTEEINLAGWTLTVDNATADADVTVSTIQLTLPSGTMIAPFGQNDKPSTVLVVTTAGRTNIDDGPGNMGANQIVNLWQSNQDDLILADVTSRRYTLLSDMAFQITLAPPAPTKTKVAATATVSEKAAAKAADARAMLKHRAATDMVGNLGADGAAAWALLMSDEGGRSSIIRAHIPVSVGPAEPEGGMMADSWALAADTSFAQATHLRASSYYGAPSDQGTPGFRAGGALPVELSHFQPARDKETGQVVISWSTQSELNNAGFFIKRSNQADGEFKVINATMIPGAGTTSEKQLYTYTDTTANPNIVYYYQIEDVSLDGQRQVLTRGIRLRGHIGAAGKATTLWGDLKSFE